MLLSEKNEILIQVSEVLNQCQFLIQSLPRVDVIDDLLQSTILSTKESKKVTEVIPATQEVPKLVAATQEVPKFVPNAQEVAKLAAAPEVVPTALEVAEVVTAAQEVAQTDVLITKALAAIKSLAPSSIYQPKKVKKKLKRR